MRLHVVDGTFELFRAHFTKRPFTETPGAVARKATVGLAASMLALLSDPEERVSHLAIAFDNPIRSVRNDWFDGYKTEEGVAPELLAQFAPAEDAMRALGIVVWSMDRYEADDAMATAAARWQGDVEQVRLLTPDKDLGQMLTGDRVVQVDRVRRRVIDETALMSVRGIRPDAVPDWLALVGDTADGIPGVAGFGEKTAAALLRAFGHIEGIPSDVTRWPSEVRGAPRLSAELEAHRADAYLYRKLATLIKDVPLSEGLADLQWAGAPRASLEALCDGLDAKFLMERCPRFR